MDTTRIDTALQRRIANEELPGACYTIVRGDEIIASNFMGWADREAGEPIGEQHLFRIFSNTKLVTSCAALQLLEQGRFSLDDDIGDHIPALKNLRVLKPGATTLDDTEPTREPVRIRHLLTHTSGLSYWFIDPNHVLSKAYAANGIADSKLTLAQQMERLGTLPLLFQPGTQWNYSVSTDVVGALIQVLSGLPIDQYFQQHIFEPLGMHDTFFVVPPEKAHRLARMYVGDLVTPLKPGLKRADHLPWPDAYIKPVPRLNPGGGLVSSLGDYTTLLRALLAGGRGILKPETMPLVLDNQLPEGLWVGLPPEGPLAGRGHSYAASVGVFPSAEDPSRVAGEIQWGGLAGTQWWISPRDNVAAVLMTQRYFGSGLPFWPEFKLNVMDALRTA